MDRLLREGNPPAGQLASPVPQYKRPGSTDYEPVEGQHGAPFAILKDASGNVVSPATDAKLEQVKSELELIKSELQTIKANQLSGDQKVQLSGPNIIKTETVITRGTRTTSQDSNVITPPVEARGFVAKLRVYGITGTFGAGEGVRMYISQRLNWAGGTRVFRNVYTKYRSTDHAHTCWWFPGLESNIRLDSGFQEATGEDGMMLIVGLPVHDRYVFGIRILGSFATEQGVDCDLVVEWYR